MNLQMQPEGATCVCSRSFRTHLLTSKIIISPPLRSTSDRQPRRAPRLLSGYGRPGRLRQPPGSQRPGRAMVGAPGRASGRGGAWLVRRGGQRPGRGMVGAPPEAAEGG